MINLDMTLVIQLINFLITLFVLNFLLVKPIRAKIRERAESIDAMTSEVEKFNEQAEGKLANYEEALAEARKAGTNERIKMKEAGEAEQDKIIADAQETAQADLGKARSEIESQTKAALETLRSQVDAMAAKAADKVLG
jgi:F-type H+-transporting ATPase subunit b